MVRPVVVEKSKNGYILFMALLFISINGVAFAIKPNSAYYMIVPDILVLHHLGLMQNYLAACIGGATFAFAFKESLEVFCVLAVHIMFYFIVMLRNRSFEAMECTR